MPIITELDSGGAHGAEGFVLDPDGSNPLDIGDPTGSLRLSSLTINPPPRNPAWAVNGDSDGSQLVRDPFYGPRTGQFQVRVRVETQDQAVVAIGMLENKLQEASARAAGGGDGLPVRWTPTGATTGLTFYMLLAEITDMPVTVDDGWFAHSPILTVAFTAKPFLYGDEVTGPTASGTTPLLTVAVPDVPGDVPAEARLVVTDGSSHARRWVEWGAEQRNYDASSPSSLFIDSPNLVTSGFAGANAALTGAYGGSAVSATLLPQTIAVCGTGSQPHIGTFRAKARIWAASTNEYWRLSYKVGDGDIDELDWQQPVAGSAFNELDLGLIDVPIADIGTQSWTGQIEAYTTNTAGETGEVDYLALFPVDAGHGRLEAAYSYRPGVVTGYDNFATLASGTALNGRVAVSGGTWATSGAATDFVGDFDDVTRSTTADAGPRFAVLGGSSSSSIESGVSWSWTSTTDPRLSTELHCLARWVDSSNYLTQMIMPNTSTNATWKVEEVVAGTPTVIANEIISGSVTSGRFRLVVYTSGLAIAWLLDSTGVVIASVQWLSANLATGGALASGKSGFADTGDITSTRTYSSFYAGTPAAEPLIINSGRALEIRSDSNQRQSSDGTTYSPDIASRGSRLFIPQSGDQALTTRLAVRAVREDPVTTASRNDGDTTNLAVFYTSRYLAVPR